MSEPRRSRPVSPSEPGPALAAAREGWESFVTETPTVDGLVMWHMRRVFALVPACAADEGLLHESLRLGVVHDPRERAAGSLHATGCPYPAIGAILNGSVEEAVLDRVAAIVEDSPDIPIRTALRDVCANFRVVRMSAPPIRFADRRYDADLAGGLGRLERDGARYESAGSWRAARATLQGDRCVGILLPGRAAALGQPTLLWAMPLLALQYARSLSISPPERIRVSRRTLWRVRDRRGGRPMARLLRLRLRAICERRPLAATLRFVRGTLGLSGRLNERREARDFFFWTLFKTLTAIYLVVALVRFVLGESAAEVLIQR